MTTRLSPSRAPHGQSLIEYLLASLVLAAWLGIALTPDSVLTEWLQALRSSYRQWSFALSLPT